ncbi:hypothetical protein NHQ30_008547 [Ciborinia camelliae]|nr:hypothetical protein NHQ30_008547 [Ciborinia camelliae]
MSTDPHLSSEASKSSYTNGTGPFARIPRELEDQIWSLVPANPGPQFVDINVVPDVEKQFEITIAIGNLSESLNSRAFNLSPNRFRFDYKIKNPEFVNIAQDIFYFYGFDTLDDYVEATGAIITQADTLNSQPQCYPTIQNIAVRLSYSDCLASGPDSFEKWLNESSHNCLIRNPHNCPADIHKFILEDILAGLLPPISKFGGFKKIYVEVEKEYMPGEGPIERVDGRLKDLLAEDAELRERYGDNVRMPEVLCLTVEEFVKEFEECLEDGVGSKSVKPLLD